MLNQRHRLTLKEDEPQRGSASKHYTATKIV